jgi:DNA-binding response OmpR family regulator
MDVFGPNHLPEAAMTEGRPRRLLVIDDDACVGAAIQAILARRNYETETAPRAHAGIHTLESSGFDLVMVDLFLPGMSGIDTITHIRRQSAIPIIAMSGFRLHPAEGSPDYLGMAMQCGASRWLRKPFTPQQLIAAIDATLIDTPASQGLMQ